MFCPGKSKGWAKASVKGKILPKSKQETQGMRRKRNEMGKKSGNKESFAQGKAKGWAKASVKDKILPKSKQEMQGMR